MSRILPVNSALALLKPGLGIGILISSLPGFLTGFSLPSIGFVLATLLGLFLVASSSFVYNQLVEQKIDAVMRRTRSRPLVTAKVSRAQAHIIGSTCLGVGFVILFASGGWLPSLIALASFLHYVFIYTQWLKPRTHWNTFWGGIAGSVGPLVSNAAVNGSVTDMGWLMFLLLFIWQPPHFWILGLVYKEDYVKAKIPILPTIVDRSTCIRQIIFYYGLLLALIVASVFMALTTPIFAIPSFLMGSVVILEALRHLRRPHLKMMRFFFLALAHMIVWHVALSLDLWFTRWQPL